MALSRATVLPTKLDAADDIYGLTVTGHSRRNECSNLDKLPICTDGSMQQFILL